MGVRSVNMDVEKVFDVLLHRMGADTKGTPYTKFKKALTPDQQNEFVSRSIQAFIHGIGEGDKDRVSIQAFSGSSDLPVLTADVFDVSAQAPNFDLLWQESFKGVKLTKGQLFWEISDVSNAITFREVPEGAKVDIAALSGDKAVVPIKKYGAGLGITWEIIEGRKLYAFAERIELVRAALYQKWADIHYGLLGAAAANHAVAYDATGATVLDKDIITLNTASYTIGNACKSLGFGDTANSRMLLYVGPSLKGRVSAAIRATEMAMLQSGRSGQILNWPIEPRFTFNANIPAGKGVLVLPGNKIQNAVYLREMGLSRQEIESLSEIRTYWSAFGASVGETNQTALVSFS